MHPQQAGTCDSRCDMFQFRINSAGRLISRAGTPTTVAPAGTSWVTTALAPTVAPSANCDAAQHGHAASNPNLAPDRDRRAIMAGFTNLHAGHARVICVPYA